MDRYGLTLKNIADFPSYVELPEGMLFIYIYIHIYIILCIYIYMYIDGVSTSLALVDPEAASRLLSTGVPPGGHAEGTGEVAGEVSIWAILVKPGRSWQP